MTQTATTQTADEFTACKTLAAQLRERLSASGSTADTQGAEVLLSYYDVDPGSVSRAELQTAYDAL